MKEAEEIKIHGELKSELRQLRKDFSMNNHSEILLWIFWMVYQKFLRYLYGDITLSRLRLALTDDDTSSHSAFDAATQIVEALSSAKHMLCVFHAVSMRYQDLVYGHLPKNETAKL